MHKRPIRQIRAVLFDWNGTLIADLKPAYRGWMACFALLGVKKITLAEFRKTYCLPWQSFYRHHGVPATTLKKFQTMLQATYRQHQKHPRLSPGAAVLIRALRAQGVRLGILSDDPRREIIRHLRRWRLLKHFAFIGTSVQFTSKPHPAGVCAFLRHGGLKPQAVLLVGDLADDIRAGQRAGVKTAAYLNGWQTPTVLRKARPDFTIKHLKEIQRLIKKIKQPVWLQTSLSTIN